LVVLKSAFRERLLEAGAQDPQAMASGPLVTGWLEGGRTRHALVKFGGESWVLKAYRRGGVVGRWNSSRYWGRGRFLEELRVASSAEERGIATAEVLALVFEDAGLGSLRAWLLTRYLPGVRPLHTYFGDRDEAAIFQAAGDAVARMHKASIDHPDLHLGNIVGSVDAGGAHAHIVDWDRARCRAPGAWNPLENLVRLWRSAEKGRKKGSFGRGDPPARARPEEGRSLLSGPVRAFIRGYFRGQPELLRRARRYFGRRAFWVGLRIWFGSARR
jgi:3-deoxy-D-manno-octulosonic acid kinase